MELRISIFRRASANSSRLKIRIFLAMMHLQSWPFFLRSSGMQESCMWVVHHPNQITNQNFHSSSLCYRFVNSVFFSEFINFVCFSQNCSKKSGFFWPWCTYKVGALCASSSSSVSKLVFSSGKSTYILLSLLSPSSISNLSSASSISLWVLPYGPFYYQESVNVMQVY